MALSIPFFKRGTAGTDATLMDEQPVRVAGGARGSVPLIGARPVPRQMRILAVVFAVSVIAFIGLLFAQVLSARFNTGFVYASGQMRTLSQQIAKSAQLSLKGDPRAFSELQQGRERFNAFLQALSAGGNVDGRDFASSPSSFAAELQALATEWAKTDRNAAQLLAQQKNLATLDQSVALINQKKAAAA